MKKNSKTKAKQQTSTNVFVNGNTVVGSSSSSSTISINSTVNSQVSGSGNITAASHEENTNLNIPKPQSSQPKKQHNTDLVNIFNKILQFQADKSEWGHFEPFRITTLPDAIKTNVLEKIQSELQELQSVNTNNNNILEEIRLKLNNPKILLTTLHDLTLQLKQETQKDNQLNLQKAKLLQNVEISSSVSLKLQESCREQQKRNKNAHDAFVLLCQEEKTRNELLKQSCESNIKDVLLSVNSEEELLLKKEFDNKELEAKIIDFQYSLSLRKQQIEAYSKAIDIQGQINNTKMTQIFKNKENNIVIFNKYQNRIQHQQEKNKFLHNQINDYSAKFIEFEKMLTQTRDVYHQVENRGREITTKAYSIELKNQTIFSKAELKQKELELLLNKKVVLDQLYRSTLQECRDEETKCRNKQTERFELSKKLEILKLKYPSIQSQYDVVLAAQTIQNQSQSVAAAATDADADAATAIVDIQLSQSEMGTNECSGGTHQKSTSTIGSESLTAAAEQLACSSACVSTVSATTKVDGQSLELTSCSLQELLQLSPLPSPPTGDGCVAVNIEARDSCSSTGSSNSSKQLKDGAGTIDNNNTNNNAGSISSSSSSICSSPNRAVSLNSSSSSSSSQAAGRRRGGGTVTAVGDDPECDKY